MDEELKQALVDIMPAVREMKNETLKRALGELINAAVSIESSVDSQSDAPKTITAIFRHLDGAERNLSELGESPKVQSVLERVKSTTDDLMQMESGDTLIRAHDALVAVILYIGSELAGEPLPDPPPHGKVM